MQKIKLKNHLQVFLLGVAGSIILDVSVSKNHFLGRNEHSSRKNRTTFTDRERSCLPLTAAPDS